MGTTFISSFDGIYLTHFSVNDFEASRICRMNQILWKVMRNFTGNINNLFMYGLHMFWEFNRMHNWMFKSW